MKSESAREQPVLAGCIDFITRLILDPKRSYDFPESSG